MDYKTILDTANAIKEKLDNFTPKVAIVLGSGFGEVIDSIENKIEISENSSLAIFCRRVSFYLSECKKSVNFHFG